MVEGAWVPPHFPSSREGGDSTLYCTLVNESQKRNAHHRRVSGVLDVTRSGKGFLLQESGDIPIPRERLRGGLAGDIVEVELSRGKFETIGSVVRVIQRKTNRFVGTAKLINNELFIVPDDPRVYLTFCLIGSETAPEGHKVIIEIFEWDRTHPGGRVREVIGRAGDHETEIRAIVAAKGFDSAFSEAVLKEAERLYEHAWDEDEIAKREDFRDTLTFTIDPDTAKDFDDAISYNPLEGGEIEVGVHIADVSHFVTPGSLIDEEAFKRATSVYLVDRTIPMLPPQLSEDLCSLMPNTDRLVFSAVFRVNATNEVVGRRFGKGIIRSRRRFTYDEADAVLGQAREQEPAVVGGKARPSGPERRPQLPDDASAYTEPVGRLWDFAKKLRAARRAAGAVMFDSAEVRPVLDENHRVVGFKRSEYTESHQLIEELMLLANREVATFVSKKLGAKNRVFVYRTHDTPNQEKVEELALFLRAIGYQLSMGRSGPSGTDLNRLLDDIKNTPEETLIKTATVRSMAKALYSTKNIGHYGLGFEYYAHFTSPIRRYPDLMVHRALKRILDGAPITEHPTVIEQRAVHASEKEAAAAQAERESVKMKQVEYFHTLVGTARLGVVTGVTEWGVYIQDTETMAEGMARLLAMTDDTYEYQPKKFAVVGKTSGRIIRLGDPVKFMVERVDLEMRQIDVTLVPSLAPSSAQ